MDAREKSNVEFRNDVYETLARHESNFVRINATLQTVLTELQTLRAFRTQATNTIDINSFSQTNAATTFMTAHKAPKDHHTNLKLLFPKFSEAPVVGSFPILYPQWLFRLSSSCGITTKAATVENETTNGHDSHVDGPWHTDYVKNMIIEAAQMADANLIIFGVDDLLPKVFSDFILADKDD